MSKPQKKTVPIAPMIIAVLLLGMIFYFQSTTNLPPQEAEELSQANLALPEDKIIRFVVDKVTDVMRLFPQKAHVSAGN